MGVNEPGPDKSLHLNAAFEPQVCGSLTCSPVTYMVEGGLLDDLFTWAAAAAGVRRGYAGKVKLH